MRPRKERVTGLDYCPYWLVSPINYTGMNFAEPPEKFSHDMSNHYLAGNVIRPQLVYENMKNQQVVPTPYQKN